MQVQHTDWITYECVLLYMLAHLIKQGGAYDDLPEFDNSVQRNYTRAPGERVILTCRVHNRGTRVVTWRRKDSLHPITIGEFVFSGDKRFRVDNNKHKEEWNLVIEGVSPEDSGSYMCIINTRKWKLEWEVQLHVKKKPKPKSSPEVQVTGNKVVVKGDLIQLHCNVTGPPDDVEWFKDGQKMTSDLDRGILITGNINNNVYISVLVIKKTSLEDTGTYICRSSNGDTGQREVNIINQKPKPKSSPEVQVTGNKVVVKGDLIQLHCNVTGPPDDVEWFKDGQKMTSDLDRGILITGNINNNVYISVLVIKKSSLEDTGTYICRSSNGDTGQREVNIINLDKENVKRGTSAELASGASSHRPVRQLNLYRHLLTFFCLIVTNSKLTTNCS